MENQEKKQGIHQSFHHMPTTVGSQDKFTIIARDPEVIPDIILFYGEIQPKKREFKVIQCFSLVQ